jgi:hypothetical protein
MMGVAGVLGAALCVLNFFEYYLFFKNNSFYNFLRKSFY